jgi:hypothetical protein
LFRLQDYDRPDRIPVALRAAQAKGDRVPETLHFTAQKPKLRPSAIGQERFKPPIVVVVGKGKRSAVIGKIQS